MQPKQREDSHEFHYFHNSEEDESKIKHRLTEQKPHSVQEILIKSSLP